MRAKEDKPKCIKNNQDKSSPNNNDDHDDNNNNNNNYYHHPSSKKLKTIQRCFAICSYDVAYDLCKVHMTLSLVHFARYLV